MKWHAGIQAIPALKRGGIGTWHKVSPKHLPAYLEEMSCPGGMFEYELCRLRRYESGLAGNNKGKPSTDLRLDRYNKTEFIAAMLSSNFPAAV